MGQTPGTTPTPADFPSGSSPPKPPPYPGSLEPAPVAPWVWDPAAADPNSPPPFAYRPTYA